VLGLLAGRQDIDVKGLDYDFDGCHLGLIVGGTEAKDVLRMLAKALGCSIWTIERENGSVWVWLGSRSPVSTEDVEHWLLDGSHREIKLVGGRVEQEIVGFSLTHKQAQAAQRVARRTRQRITWYADVEAVALVMHDEALARSMVSAWIAPIIRQRDGSTLFRTLQAYFACSHNKAETAKAIPADRHTVERHLHRVGELVGQPLKECGPKVELALQVYELWGDDGPKVG
jgi:DNA-binding PucR family transcriptional regulator